MVIGKIYKVILVLQFSVGLAEGLLRNSIHVSAPRSRANTFSRDTLARATPSALSRPSVFGGWPDRFLVWVVVNTLQIMSFFHDDTVQNAWLLFSLGNEGDGVMGIIFFYWRFAYFSTSSTRTTPNYFWHLNRVELVALEKISITLLHLLVLISSEIFAAFTLREVSISTGWVKTSKRMRVQGRVGSNWNCLTSSSSWSEPFS